MFMPSIGYAELIFRAVIVYLTLFVLLRFIGKKHIGQLSPFDLVVLLIISPHFGAQAGTSGSPIATALRPSFWISAARQAARSRVRLLITSLPLFM